MVAFVAKVVREVGVCSRICAHSTVFLRGANYRKETGNSRSHRDATFRYVQGENPRGPFRSYCPCSSFLTRFRLIKLR